MGNNKDFNAESAIQLWKASEDFAKHCEGASYSDFMRFFCHVTYNFIFGYYNNTKRNVGSEEWLMGELAYFTDSLKRNCDIALRMLLNDIKDSAAVAATVAALAEGSGKGAATEGVQRSENSTASE